MTFFHSEDCPAPQGKVNSFEIQEPGQQGVLCSEVVWRRRSWGLPTFQPRLLQQAEGDHPAWRERQNFAMFTRAHLQAHAMVCF